VDLLRVTKSLICGELHHPSGLQGKRFVRFRIGFDYTCCKEGCENNLEKLQKAGFPHMQTQGCTCLLIKHVSTCGCGCGAASAGDAALRDSSSRPGSSAQRNPGWNFRGRSDQQEQ